MELAEHTEEGHTIALNAYYTCKDWGGRPDEDLFPDHPDPNFRYALNNFVRRIGVEHENEQAEERDAERQQQIAHQKAQAAMKQR